MEKAMLQQTLVFQFFIIFLGVAWVAFKVRFRLNSTLRDTKNSISSQGSQNRENPKPSQKSGRPGKQIITGVKQIITYVNIPAFSESCVLPLLYSAPPRSFAPAAKSRLYNLKPSLTAA